LEVNQKTVADSTNLFCLPSLPAEVLYILVIDMMISIFFQTFYQIRNPKGTEKK